MTSMRIIPRTECPVDRVGADKGPEQHDDGSAEDGPQEGKPSAEEAHDHDLHGEGPEEHIGKYGRIDHDEKHPGYTGKKAADDKGDELVALHVDPDHLAPDRDYPGCPGGRFRRET